MSWLTGTWSPLCQIIGTAGGRRWIDLCDPDGPGVYRLVALDSNAELAPAPIDRVCGVDPTGTLYIGHAGSLRSRLRQLARTNDPTEGIAHGHVVMAAKLKKRFPPQRLAITWQRAVPLQTRNRDEALAGVPKAVWRIAADEQTVLSLMPEASCVGAARSALPPGAV
jgi:hypothetical protein